MCVLELMKRHVLQTLREQLKVPSSRLEGSELLTSEFLRFQLCLNETSGGLGKIAMKCLISFPNVAILTTSYLKHSTTSKLSIENLL